MCFSEDKGFYFHYKKSLCVCVCVCVNVCGQVLLNSDDYWMGSPPRRSEASQQGSESPFHNSPYSDSDYDTPAVFSTESFLQSLEMVTSKQAINQPTNRMCRGTRSNICLATLPLLSMTEGERKKTRECCGGNSGSELFRLSFPFLYANADMQANAAIEAKNKCLGDCRHQLDHMENDLKEISAERWKAVSSSESTQLENNKLKEKMTQLQKV